MIEIDHIFIFSNKGKETNELIDFGLTEGSGRTHKGIGTANRRIFFDNFYLEILWVENELEARSVENIGIWERSNFKNSQYSRFGLCLKNTEETDSVFINSMKWNPDFLPENKFVDILTNERMPWIFRFPANKNDKLDEPRNHKNGIKKLTKAIFNLSKIDFKSVISKINKNATIEFIQSVDDLLILEFDHGVQGKTKQFDNLNLRINY